MGITQYTEEEIKVALNKIKEDKAEIVYVSDSYGSLLPEEVERLVKVFKETGKQIGLHPHNNLQLAFANTLSAMKAGAEYIDATVNGMGRGAGNLSLETILLYLNKFNPKYNVSSILGFIEQKLPALKKKVTWGYEPLYLLSGINSCHPKYASSLKDEGKSLKDILPVLQKVKYRDPPGFNADVLEISKNSNQEIIVILPCHKGSQRIKDKNTRDFAGSSLTEIKIKQLLKVPEIKEILVFTDDVIITEICSRLNDGRIKVNLESRPDVKDNSELIAHFADKLKGDEHILWTHVTSPFIDEKIYSRAIRQYLSNLDKNLASSQV